MTEEKKPSLLLNQFIPYRMVNLSKKVSEACSHIYFEEFGLTIPEWRVLAILSESGSMHAKAIGELSLMDKSTISRAVKLLEDKGLLSRNKDADDNRVTYLVLTANGKNLYHDIVPKVLEWEAKLIGALSVSEYRDLMRIMNILDIQLDVMMAD